MNGYKCLGRSEQLSNKKNNKNEEIEKNIKYTNKTGEENENPQSVLGSELEIAFSQ